MGSRDQARPWFFLTYREFIETLIYQRHRTDGAGMAEGPDMAEVLFSPQRIY